VEFHTGLSDAGFNESSHKESTNNFEFCITLLFIVSKYSPQAGWVSCVLDTKEQAENTKRLIQEAYDTCVSLKSSHKLAN